MKAIFSRLKGLNSVSGSPRYRQLMDKLSVEKSESAIINDHIIIGLATWDKSLVSGKIDLIRTAIENNEKIHSDITRRAVRAFAL